MNLSEQDYCDRFDIIKEKLAKKIKDLGLEKLSKTEQIKLILGVMNDELGVNSDPDKVLLITQLYNLEELTIEEICSIVNFTKNKVLYILAFSMDLINQSIIGDKCDLEYSTHKPRHGKPLLDIKI